MTKKGKFIYLYPCETGYRVLVKGSDFAGYPKGTKFELEHGIGIPLSQMSTDDLFKVKAQLATELESRMDLDEVTEANLTKLKEHIRDASSETIAQLLRQTLDRLDVVASDEKRVKTRQQILEDELRRRMIDDGVTEMKFSGLIQATYKQETVYNVGEEGWDTVYSGIVADTLESQLKLDKAGIVAQLDIDAELQDLTENAKEALFAKIDTMRGKLRREKDEYGTDISEALGLLDDVVANLEDTEIATSTIKSGLVDSVATAMVDNVRSGIKSIDAFSIIQKRLTSTTLNELVKQGEELPRGIESQFIRKLKIKRTK